MGERAADIKRIADMMRNLDFCMMTTHSSTGMRARPMSNNGEVEFDGDVWFVSAAESRKVDDSEG
jgi:general stress protein 26